MECGLGLTGERHSPYRAAMPLYVRKVQESDHAALRSLIAHPSLVREFELLQGDVGLDNVLRDPFCPPEARVVAVADGVSVGFGFAFVIASGDHHWAMLRIAVPEPHRRRGIGTRVVTEVARRVTQVDPHCDELCLSAWQPCEGAAALATRQGFREVRRFWLMERPHGPVPAPVWPAGTEFRVFDGSDRSIADLTDAYNDSFSQHYHFFSTTVQETAALSKLSRFEADGVMLAYRDGKCVGYCRCERMPARGEIASLGVVAAARGIGLGRALLRWGTDWLERCQVPVVTLVVDGENENALGLYHSEGYAVARTRPIWSKRIPGR